MRYPSNTLPYPNLQALQSYTSTLVESETDQKTFLRSPVTSEDTKMMSVSFRLDKLQYGAWLAFVIRDLDNGTKQFTAEVVTDVGKFQMAVLRLVEGKFSARFTGPDTIDIEAQVDYEPQPFVVTLDNTFQSLDSTELTFDSLL